MAGVVALRPVRAGDAAGAEALWRRLDARDRRRFTDLAHLPPDRAGDVALARPGHAAGVVATGPAGQVAGVARYERTAGDIHPGHDLLPGAGACPTRPDLAVVAVPAPAVARVVDQAGTLGVRAVCVISAGFAEIGGQGRGLQDKLRRRARVAGVRLIEPNCMGLLNGGPDPWFNATFSPVFPPPGHLAFVPQSGGLGLAALAPWEEQLQQPSRCPAGAAAPPRMPSPKPARTLPASPPPPTWPPGPGAPPLDA